MVEDDEDKWEVFDDNVTDETLEEIDNEVNEDFLEQLSTKIVDTTSFFQYNPDFDSCWI